jgi:excinuclease ABC subunit B
VAEESAGYATDDSGPGVIAHIPRDELARMVKDIESQMKTAARDLEFEKAALLRDQVVELRRIIEVDPVRA